MELAPNLQKTYDTNGRQEIIVAESTARELALLALMSALDQSQQNEDYASGPDFPNIPFGD